MGIEDFIRKKNQSSNISKIELVIRVDRDISGNISDDSLNRAIIKILSVSTLLDEEYHIGQANEIVFGGQLGKEIFKYLEKNPKLSHIKSIGVDDKTALSRIDVVRKGDFVKAVPDGNGNYNFIVTDTLQDDVWKTIIIEENKNKEI